MMALGRVDNMINAIALLEYTVIALVVLAVVTILIGENPND